MNTAQVICAGVWIGDGEKDMEKREEDDPAGYIASNYISRARINKKGNPRKQGFPQCLGWQGCGESHHVQRGLGIRW